MRTSTAQALQVFSFTIRLDGEHEHTPELEDRLYEAGCDDALVHSKGGLIFLDFDREGSDVYEAINSAVRSVRNAGFQIGDILGNGALK
jgi:hypothetical protein